MRLYRAMSKDTWTTFGLFQLWSSIDSSESRDRTNISARAINGFIELEYLEQKITLALYEIDANFSRCHRIVTTKILPILERYAEHSRRVWEGSKFWKQFFETSANVSLSGYEELSQQELVSEPVETNGDALEMTGEKPIDASDPPWTSTPLNTPSTLDTPSISSAVATACIADDRSSIRTENKNPLLHRVLDASWRLQVTPHRSFPSQRRISNVLEASSSSQPAFNLCNDDDLDVSLPIGLSPPVTMQFSLPPSKLLKTPAKDAARYVVEDILRTAGADESGTRPDMFLRATDSPLAPVDNRRVLFEWDVSSED
ncbi:hypothetical protein PCK2_000512 [Pneumocystis canis]|nr:hypothetical protein PCK2_000512 [Pneumocystis canis]